MGYFEAKLFKSRGRYITACMENNSESVPSGWKASLRLRFVREGERTLARERVHSGPLRLLKTHYPEGDSVAHAILVHPPAGIVAGDSLDIGIDVGPGAHALLTTPGAQKWYRATTVEKVSEAYAKTTLRVESDATLEWLPMESMIYDGCVGNQELDFSIQERGKLLAWEMQQWGRSARGETFARGTFSQRISVRVADQLMWTEAMHVKGGGALLQSPTGFGAMPCVGTMFIVGLSNVVAALTSIRADCENSELSKTCGATSPFSSGIIVKAVAPEMEPLRTLFVHLREVVRPFLCVRNAEDLRVWAT
jgi:urease accessory protein